MDIAAWLRELGLERYELAFRENEIGLDVLPKLTGEDLKEIGVIPVGDRRRLLEAITVLARESEPAPPHAAREVVEAPPKSAEAERRQLTVMFFDLVGSTAACRRLDPEDMGEVIERVSARRRRRWSSASRAMSPSIWGTAFWPISAGRVRTRTTPSGPSGPGSR